MAGRIPPSFMPPVGHRGEELPVDGDDAPGDDDADHQENWSHDDERDQTEQGEAEALRERPVHHRSPPRLFFWKIAGSGREVDEEGEHEEDDADAEKCVVVRASPRHLAHFRRNGRGHRAHRLEKRGERGGHHPGVSRDHHHGHGLADRPAHAEHHRGEDARACRGHHDAPDRLPARGAHGKARVTVALRHGIQRVLRDADDRRQRHVGEDERAR